MYISQHISKMSFQGSRGILAATLVQPAQADTLVILMHGLLSHRDYRFFKRMADDLAGEGIASLRFDFNGHGESEGKLQDMTVENELQDAQAVLDAVKQWSWVKHIIVEGHSLGGVVAGLLAAKNESDIQALIQISAAAVMHDDARNGKIMNATYDPVRIPEYVRVFFVKKIGRAYLEAARDIDVFARSCTYSGPVCLIHGKKDTIVPYRYSEQYHQQYPHSELHLIENENHLLLHNPALVAQIALRFIKEHNPK